MPSLRSIGLWAALVAVSAAISYGLTHAHFPAALLLGPMIGAIGFGVGGSRLHVPRPAFNAAQAMIGCLVAHAVTGQIAQTLLEDGPLIVAVVFVTVAVSGVVGLVLTRLRVLPGTTAAWGSSPGGASAMVAMAEDFGADPRLVAFMQYVRVAAVVFSASLAARFLMENPAAAGASGGAEAVEPLSLLATLAVAVIGAGAALALRVPAGAQIGPMVLGSLLHATGVVRMALPVPILELAYACIGIYVGLRFTRETLRRTVTALPGILVATFSVIALCGAWGWGLTLLLPIDLLTAVLATSPGGLDSVAIIAVGSKADVSFVLAVQTLRLFVVLLTGPLLAKWISRSVPEGAAR
ncbi:AbrB family transcriptional regulator [Methylobacterium sp. J-088]|uniref:AbrB family transcriptional regulator n=1 Tax=unclassified Methylobacterium TaxID=2615210 RepID=UPI001FBAC1D8|nr:MULTISPECIES: AbrB family transcriptional regulator [unclassified Methylobacterium]MCJ2062850.1 AbrB family transcriptional regulator [Methylobacterium sp. J-088]